MAALLEQRGEIVENKFPQDILVCVFVFAAVNLEDGWAILQEDVGGHPQVGCLGETFPSA